MLVVGETVQQNHFELLEMYMLDTSLQFGLLMKAQIIRFGLQEHSRIRTLISIILIVFGCNIRHRPPLIMWMLKHTRGRTPPVLTFGMRIRGLILVGPIQIVLWMHGNPGFGKGL